MTGCTRPSAGKPFAAKGAKKRITSQNPDFLEKACSKPQGLLQSRGVADTYRALDTGGHDVEPFEARMAC